MVDLAHSIIQDIKSRCLTGQAASAGVRGFGSSLIVQMWWWLSLGAVLFFTCPPYLLPSFTGTKFGGNYVHLSNSLN